MLFATGPQGGISAEDQAGEFNGLTTTKILSPAQTALLGLQQPGARSGGMMVDDLNGDATPIGAYQMFSGDGGILTLDRRGKVTPIKFGTTISPQPFSDELTFLDSFKTNSWPKFVTTNPCHIFHNFHSDTGTMTMIDDGYQTQAPYLSNFGWETFGGLVAGSTFVGEPDATTPEYVVERSNAKVKIKPGTCNPFTPGPSFFNISYQGAAGFELYVATPLHPDYWCFACGGKTFTGGPDCTNDILDTFDPATSTLVWTSPDTPSLLTYVVPNPFPVFDNSFFYLHAQFTDDDAQIVSPANFPAYVGGGQGATIVLEIHYD